jgi:pimeloyl-ACP methyl ester carboxylesterase
MTRSGEHAIRRRSSLSEAFDGKQLGPGTVACTSAPGQLDLWDQVISVQQPTLIVHGDDDRIIPRSEGRRLVSLNNRFTFVSLAGLGHVPQEESPQTFLDVVLPWLRKTPGLMPAVSARGEAR